MAGSIPSLKDEAVLVVGGCGFLGRHIVDMLISAHGHPAVGEGLPAKVVVLDVRPPREALPDSVVFVQGDLTDRSSIASALRSHAITVVIHTASPPHGLSNAVYWKVNVEGTRNLIEACQDSAGSGTPVRKLIYTSSASVVYNGQSLVNADESLPYCDVHMDAYNETKAVAEDMVLKANGVKGLLTIAIRPSGIFGPRDMQGAYNIVKTARSGKTAFQVGPNTTLFDWTYVENVAYAHILAAQKLDKENGTAGEAFFITNDSPIFFWDFVKKVWEKLGYKDTLKYTLPLPLAYTIAYILEFIAYVLSPILTYHPSFTVFRIMVFSNNRYFNVTKAKRVLGYKPIVSLEEGIEKTVEFFKDVKF